MIFDLKITIINRSKLCTNIIGSSSYARSYKVTDITFNIIIYKLFWYCLIYI